MTLHLISNVLETFRRSDGFFVWLNERTDRPNPSGLCNNSAMFLRNTEKLAHTSGALTEGVAVSGVDLFMCTLYVRAYKDTLSVQNEPISRLPRERVSWNCSNCINYSTFAISRRLESRAHETPLSPRNEN